MTAVNTRQQPCLVALTVNLDFHSVDAGNAKSGGLFGRHSYGRYGAREGIWRLLDTFEKAAVPATFFMAPADAADQRDLLATIRSLGHEIAVRGSVMDSVSDTADLTRLARDKMTIAEACGVEPAGWRAINGLMSEETGPELARLGYLYDSTTQDDDVPYLMSNGKDQLVELPIFDYLTDATFYAAKHTNARARLAFFEEAMAQYNAGAYINMSLHARGDIGSGRAPRAQVVADLIQHLGALEGIAFQRCSEIATACRDRNEAESFPTRRPPDREYPA